MRTGVGRVLLLTYLAISSSPRAVRQVLSESSEVTDCVDVGGPLVTQPENGPARRASLEAVCFPVAHWIDISCLPYDDVGFNVFGYRADIIIRDKAVYPAVKAVYPPEILRQALPADEFEQRHDTTLHVVESFSGLRKLIRTYAFSSSSALRYVHRGHQDC